jgi:hypothetical protein
VRLIEDTDAAILLPDAPEGRGGREYGGFKQRGGQLRIRRFDGRRQQVRGAR